MFACAARIGSLPVSPAPGSGVGGEGSRIGRILDRIALVLVKAEHGEAFFYVLRKRRRHVNDSVTRMGQDQPARQKMQLGLKPWRDRAQRVGARRVVRGLSIVFRITHDRMADRLAMGPKLMGAA